MTELETVSKAPWTPEQVESLNEYQRAGVMHPFTCGRCRDERGTRFYYDSEGNINPEPDAEDWVLMDVERIVLRERELVATLAGWICPTCDYTQDWAHSWMVNGAWRGQQRLMQRLFRSS